jgi:hypothetical protein
VRKYAAEQGISASEAIEKDLNEKADQFTKKGAEVYAKV